MPPLFQLRECIFGLQWMMRSTPARSRAHNKSLRHLPRFARLSNGDQKPPQYGGIP
jgi:hypothetical protein